MTCSFKLFTALVGFLVLGSVSAQVCDPDKGCNDPKAASVTAVLPAVGVKAPQPTGTSPVTYEVGAPVDVVIKPYINSIKVGPMPSICVGWVSGGQCSASPTVPFVVSSTKVLSGGLQDSATLASTAQPTKPTANKKPKVKKVAKKADDCVKPSAPATSKN